MNSFAGFISGCAIGLVGGFMFAMHGQVQLDKRSVEDGVVKLCGKYYTLKPFDMSKNVEE